MLCIKTIDPLTNITGNYYHHYDYSSSRFWWRRPMVTATKGLVRGHGCLTGYQGMMLVQLKGGQWNLLSSILTFIWAILIMHWMFCSTFTSYLLISIICWVIINHLVIANQLTIIHGRDFNDFLDDLEEDQVYRQNVNIYRSELSMTSIFIYCGNLFITHTHPAHLYFWVVHHNSLS